MCAVVLRFHFTGTKGPQHHHNASVYKMRFIETLFAKTGVEERTWPAQSPGPQPH